MERRTCRAARVLRDVQRLLEHDCEAEAIERIHDRTRVTRRWLWERLSGWRDMRPTLEAVLVEACWSGDADMIRLLLRMGANPSGWTEEHGFVLDALARTGPTASLRELLVASIPEHRLAAALTQAAIADRAEAVVALLRRRASPEPLVRLGDGSHLRMRGSILRLLQAHGARFSPGIQRMLAKGVARGDPGQT